MSKNLIIRADANTQIGTGHVMRCIALAQAWQDRGGNVTFLSHCDSKTLRKRIIDEGFAFISVEKAHPDPYDLGHTLEMLGKFKIQNSKFKTWVILDGYHFTSDYQKAIRENGYKLLVIDDMAHLDHCHADILLNQNIHASILHYSCDRDTVKLLGCEYVLLRREFLKYQDWKREIPDKARKILVTLGGGDPDNVTLEVIRALNSLNVSDIEVKVVVGPANKNIKSLERELHLSPFTFHVLSSVSSMPELMVWSDVAISAGGSTCWEMAFIGLPALIITVSDNQIEIAKELEHAEVAIYLGWHESTSIHQITKVLKKISQDKNKRTRLSERGRRLVNGKGVIEIIKAMLDGQISLRRAQKNDCELLWKWANDPEARAASFSSSPISWEEHTNWFNSKLNSANCMMYVATIDNGTPLGQIRYDIKQENAVISISIDSKFRSKDYGTVLIRKTSQILFAESNVRRVHAYVKQDNNSSASVFTKAGFKKLELTTLHAQQATHFVLERFTS